MFRTMCHAKIHLATVTETRLDYVGSITIDPNFLEKVDLLPYEKVAVVNRNNGYRAETYIIEGVRGSGTIGINGALASVVASTATQRSPKWWLTMTRVIVARKKRRQAVKTASGALAKNAPSSKSRRFPWPSRARYPTA